MCIFISFVKILIIIKNKLEIPFITRNCNQNIIPVKLIIMQKKIRLRYVSWLTADFLMPFELCGKGDLCPRLEILILTICHDVI